MQSNRISFKGQKIYVGIDVHLKKWSITVITEKGFKLVAGGTDNHLMLADLRPMNITGKELQIRCDANHITLNKNAIPGDPQKPTVTSGVRIGTAAVTTRGLGAEEMMKIAEQKNSDIVACNYYVFDKFGN